MFWAVTSLLIIIFLKLLFPFCRLDQSRRQQGGYVDQSRRRQGGYVDQSRRRQGGYVDQSRRRQGGYVDQSWRWQGGLCEIDSRQRYCHFEHPNNGSHARSSCLLGILAEPQFFHFYLPFEIGRHWKQLICEYLQSKIHAEREETNL